MLKNIERDEKEIKRILGIDFREEKMLEKSLSLVGPYSVLLFRKAKLLSLKVDTNDQTILCERLVKPS